jgi:hypothetical protein
MHHVDITLSVSGSNLLQSFKEVRHSEPTCVRPQVLAKTPGEWLTLSASR